MIRINCPSCGKELLIPDHYAGQTGSCKFCGSPITAPAASEPAFASEPAQDLSTAPYAPPPPQQWSASPQARGHSLDGLIPTGNPPALIAYYCGVFGLIPCIGLPLGIVALVFGAKGLSLANRHPEAKGKIHAIVGLVLGTLEVLGNGFGIAAMIAGAIGG